ncbi:NlpC/P60 family protein [Streptomyces sp. A7024]|uniref:NlpC/P60 family protein n=2 Tax=Streptomyces coryli TaxID=1128680 RepID=A0A6G4UC88_9ACTN|nr:NlpC/P60 family protein [Streptomyces coryli]
MTPAQTKAKVEKLYHEAEQVTEKYNGAKEKAGKAEEALGELRDEAARKTAALNSARNRLGSLATRQYRSGGVDPSLQLALSSDPDSYLNKAALAERAGSRQATAVAGLAGQMRAVERVRGAASAKVRELTAAEERLRGHKKTIEGKLAEARRLLNSLPADQRDALLRGGDHGGGTVSRAVPRGSIKAPNARAARAVAFAYGALGKPYVWGATGPNAFDCSGLTQAAWRSAGVALPRTTYTQVNAGTRVPRSGLAPGDLVFFYGGLSHVGMYIGGGQMIHAPRPGAPVRVAPVDSMPFAAAVRPA